MLLDIGTPTSQSKAKLRQKMRVENYGDPNGWVDLSQTPNKKTSVAEPLGFSEITTNLKKSSLIQKDPFI